MSTIREPQGAADVLMVRPVRFVGNPETQGSNAFQSREGTFADASVQAAAVREFDALCAALREAGVAVHVFDDTPEPHTPDSIFPNNWVSFHADGTVVLYPMMAENRRTERREEMLEALSTEHGFRIARVVSLTGHERENRFLEGTGSLVLDRTHRVAYACVSPRTDLDVLGDFAQQLDYDMVTFEATDTAGVPIYHTNVMMCVGARFAAICSACIRAEERAAVIDALRSTGHAIVELDMEQLASFAGNMLELRTARAGSVVAMSRRAHDSLSAAQRVLIETHGGPIIDAPIPTIETLGGGSVRCMLAEVHLPRKK